MEEVLPDDKIGNITLTKKQLRREKKKKQQEDAEAGNVMLVRHGIRKNIDYEDGFGGEGGEGEDKGDFEQPLSLLWQDDKTRMEELFHYSDDAVKEFNERMSNNANGKCPDEILAEVASLFPRSDESYKPDLSRFLLSPLTHVGAEVKDSGFIIMHITWFGNLSYKLRPQLKKCWKDEKCTYGITKDNYVKQVGYNCSCFKDETMSICRICAKKCHNDKSKHKLTQISNEKVMFCDCGAGVKTEYARKCNCC